MALKDISRDCTDSTKPYAEAVIASIQQSLQADRLNPGECVRLMYPLGKMLSLLPPATILPCLHPIVAKPLEELHQLNKGLPDNNAKARLLFVLKLLTMLFTTLDIHIQDDQPESEAAVSTVDSRGEKVEQPVLVILRQCLPVYQQLCSTYNTDSEISEAVCLNLKQAVAILQDDMRPLTQEVLTLALACYRAAPQPAALDLSKQFFIMYGREEGMVEPLRSLLTELSNTSLTTIQAAATLSDQADLIDCFFAMLGQVRMDKA